MAAIVNTAPAYWFTGGGQGYQQITGDYAALSYMVRRELKKRGMISPRATLPVLVNNAIGAGGNVNAGYNRAAYGPVPPLTPGGVQPVEYVPMHTGPTTTADAALLAGLSNFPTQPVAYPRNGDGNPRGNNGG